MALTVWNGPQISQSIREVSAAAIGETTHDAAAYAAANHEWQSETGRLQASITALDPEIDAAGASGRWGAGEPYAIDVEHETPFLRPAGDASYPALPARIRDRLTK